MPLKLKVVALCNENQAFMQYKKQGLFEGKRQRSTSPKDPPRLQKAATTQKAPEQEKPKASAKGERTTTGMKDAQRSYDG